VHGVHLETVSSKHRCDLLTGVFSLTTVLDVNRSDVDLFLGASWTVRLADFEAVGTHTDATHLVVHLTPPQWC